MNEPPTLPVPPFGLETDEALSALLDGELAEFASERGLTEETVRAQLDAWPGFDARLAALERVRAEVAAPIAPLDDVTRRRLVRNASSEVSSGDQKAEPSRSWAAITAIAAAGLLVVAGIGVAVSSMGDGGGGDASNTAAFDSSGGATRGLRGDVGDLGDVTDPAALRALLDGRESAAAGASTTVPATPAEPPTGEQDATGRSIAGGEPTAGSLALSPEACARELAGERDVQFTGTGTFEGAPVTIVGITDGGRTIVFVVPSSDCTNVLASISR